MRTLGRNFQVGLTTEGAVALDVIGPDGETIERFEFDLDNAEAIANDLIAMATVGRSRLPPQGRA